MRQVIDMVGQRCGFLTVLRRAGSAPTGGAQWECRCDCGEVVVATSHRLRHGNNQSCGCYWQAEDLTGKRYERLFVESLSHKKCGTTYWNCRCDCGERRVVSVERLRKGKTKSCGCYRRDVSRQRLFKDIKDQRFGRLVAIEYVGMSKHKKALWKCLCDCGNEHVTSQNMLQKQHTTSCGCAKREGPRKRAFNLTDQRFGRLLVLGETDRDTSKRRLMQWLCVCDCGKIVVVPTASLRHDNTKSCGCLNRDIVRAVKTTHGLRHTPEYSVWIAMIQRCYNPSDPAYRSYGGRGITVCERWLDSVANFYEDMGPRPEGLSIDRVDVNGPYSKENARWATQAQQCDNRRNTIVLTHNGETRTLTEWARHLGVCRKMLYIRLKYLNWPVEAVLSAERQDWEAPGATGRYKERAMAMGAVHRALETGRLVKPPTCEHPGCNKPPDHAHHHSGYGFHQRLLVRWYCVQHHMREHSKFIEFNGERKTVSEWAAGLGITRAALCSRLRTDRWTFEEAMTTPKMARKVVKKKQTARTGKKRRK